MLVRRVAAVGGQKGIWGGEATDVADFTNGTDGWTI
jgi:hypothetical protein